MEIRDAGPSDAELVIDLVQRSFRHLAPSMVRAVVTEQATAYERVVRVAVRSDVVVGVGLQFRLPVVPPSQRARYVAVGETARGSGVGHALAASLDGLLPEGVMDLTTTLDDEDAQALAVCEHWGFRALQHSLTFELPLQRLAKPRLPPGVSVELSNGLELGDQAAVEAMLDASQTNPERAHNGPLTLQQLRGWVAPGSGDTPVAVIVRVSGHPAALSYGIAAGDLGQVIYTGVDPASRGHGLGRLAKQALHVALRDLGATRAVTTSAEANVGIQRVNASLGYRHMGGVWWLHRRAA